MRRASARAWCRRCDARRPADPADCRCAGGGGSGAPAGLPGLRSLQRPGTADRGPLRPNGLVFVAEKAGRILVYENLGDETPELFADLRTEVYDHADRGLLGLALDPAFPTKPYVYALYTYDHVLGAEKPRRPNGASPNQTGDECPQPTGTAPTTAWSAAASSATRPISRKAADHLHADAGAETALIRSLVPAVLLALDRRPPVRPGRRALRERRRRRELHRVPTSGSLATPANPCGDPNRRRRLAAVPGPASPRRPPTRPA